MKLDVQISDDEAIFDELEAEWNALDAQTVPRLPFTSPRWNRIWWKHYGRTSPDARDHLRLAVLRCEQNTLVAVAPMMLTSRPSAGPLRTHELQFLGADANITEIRGMVCRPGLEAEALHALSQHLVTLRDWDWVQWRGLRHPDPTTLLPAFRPGNPLIDNFIQLAQTWDEQRSLLSRNLKESLRKCYNSLSRDGHAWTFEAIGDPRDLGSELQRLMRYHELRSLALDTIPHPNAFASPESQRMIAEYVAEAGATGDVRIFALRIGDSLVAMRMGFICGRDLYLYYSGYDLQWSPYSVMTTVVAETVKWAIAQGFERVNLSTGEDESKRRWRPQQIKFSEGYEPAPSRRGRLALAAFTLLRDRRRAAQIKVSTTQPG